jgi:hypothetical protein
MSPTAIGKPIDPPRRTERTAPADPLARALGWASSGLGVPQMTAPGVFARSIGVRDTPRSRALTRAVGLRELAAASGILSRKRPVGWLWSRVAGEVMDLVLLSAALRQRGAQRDRVRAAMGAVAGITAADVVASVRASKENGGFVPPGARLKKSAITIRRPLEEVRESWNDRDLRSQFFFDGEERDVRYAAAPGGAGTEVRLELARGEAAPILRRFKQLVETGEIARSDGSPDGPLGMRQLKQRPAQPPERRTS